MKWEGVRNLYPNQYVKLNILDFYLEDDRKIVTDVALINIIENSKLATKEDTIVHHTGSDKIIIGMRTTTGLRGHNIG